MIIRQLTQLIALVIILLLPLVLSASEVNRKNEELFVENYSKYEKHIASNALRKALPFALKSHELGKALYEKDHENQITLARNVGVLYTRLYQDGEASQYLSEALGIAETVYGKQSAQLIDILVELGTSKIRVFKSGAEMRYFKRALKISKISFGKESKEYGELSSNLGDLITQRSRTMKGKKYLDRGLEILERVEGKDSSAYGMAAFYKGKYELSAAHYKKAAVLFNDALIAFQDRTKSVQHVELSTRAFLVEVYEKLGESELATQHCLAIGRVMPNRRKQDFLPVFRAAPDFPKPAQLAGSEGWVDFIFNVDKAGFVKDPKITSSTGHSAFKSAAMEAVQKYRYAPAFIHGEPVLTEGAQIRISFVLD